jgi:uncharacterized protein YodC (DUF2158 family)
MMRFKEGDELTGKSIWTGDRIRIVRVAEPGIYEVHWYGQDKTQFQSEWLVDCNFELDEISQVEKLLKEYDE